MLDPFEVMDRFGTDALRYYCFREVSFGQDGGVSTTTFGERYETELANEFGNLASRTLNMLGRYRDGAVPAVEVDPALGDGLRGAREEVSRAARPGGDHAGAGAHLAARAAAEPLRRGERALAAGQGRVQGRRAEHRRCARWPRACASLTVLLTPYIPESAEKLLAALGAPDIAIDGARLRRRTPAGSRSRSSRPLFPKPE